MARPENPGASAYLTLLLLLLPAAAATSYSSLCDSPAVATDLVGAAGEYDDTALLDLPLPSNGYFSGGDELLFASDRRLPRSFSFSPRRAARTTNPALLHLFATVTLHGFRDLGRRGGRQYSVSFDLEGYYSTAPAVLCMVGSGSRARDDGMGVVILRDVAFRLRLPQPANLMHPFVTGSLVGADFRPVSLVAYAEGKGYAYGETASCPPPPGPVRAAHQVLDGDFSCNHLTELLRSSYSLEYGTKGSPSRSSPLRLRHRRMHVDQVHCAKDGAVRAYMAFYTSQSDGFPLNITMRRGDHWRRTPHGLAIGDEALVADGLWDSSRSRLCLRACRVARSAPSEPDVLAVRECGVGMQFWFPAVWSIRDRHVVAGSIWNTSTKSGGVISVSRTGHSTSDLSGIKYNYTRVEEARKHYDSKPELSKETKARLPGNYSYHDFAFDFYMTKQDVSGYGHASPVAFGAILVAGESLMAEDRFSRYPETLMNNQRLLNVSYEYDLQLYHYTNLSAAGNVSFEQWSISAEGVYDTKSGSLCMVACRVLNSSSSDCEILVTLQFSSIGTAGVSERGVGEISSLRKKTDPLFFEALQIGAQGMSVVQVAESVSRMDMEGTMLVASMTLSCVFILLQLRHATKNPDAVPAMSITMLVVLAVGYMIPLVVNFEAMFSGGSKHYVQLASGGWLELNELALRVSTMVAFVLQLRLLQLAWSGRSAEDETWATERSSLWVCLPLYLVGGVVVWIVHMSDVGGHGAAHAIQARLVAVNGRRSAALLSEDLVSYAGLILDGFLLPQVISNAFSGSRVRAISPWFYAGTAVIRATPHAYDALRARSFVRSLRPSDVYASHGDDLFGAAWDVVVPCGVAVLAVLLFLQQRLGGAFMCCLKSRKLGEYEMVATVSS